MVIETRSCRSPSWIPACLEEWEPTISSVSFASLTPLGQTRRLRALALAALAEWDIVPRRVRALTNHLNALFRVDTADGARYVLRISVPGYRSDRELRSELAWLQALAAEPEIAAPAPVANRAGELVTIASAPGVPEPRRCVLLAWVPGVQLAQRLDAEHVARFGMLAARLHAQAARWAPPAEFTTTRLDRILPRGERDALRDPAMRVHVDDVQHALLQRAIAHAEAALARRWAGPEAPRVIHGDLHHENVLVARGRLRPVDFEDVIWGYPVQDIALTFYDFRYYTDPAVHDYPTLCRWFRAGYERLAPWPEGWPGEIDAHLLARRLWVLNWVLLNDPLDPTPFIARVSEEFRELLDAE